MGHPTDTQIFRAIKEGFAEVLENIRQQMSDMDDMLEEIKRRLVIGNV